MVFFDDILVYSEDQVTHAEHVRKAFEILEQNQLHLKKSKCEFGVSQIEYLGHIISHEGVATDPGKVKAMKEWPMPKDVKSLRGFLGLTGYYRRFIQGYGLLSEPLTDLLRKGAFKWHEGAQKAFEDLKEAMTQALVLALPDFSQTFTIETDANKEGIGAVLMQNRRPLAYLSKKLGPKNQLLSTYEKEFLALLTAISKWRNYLLGGKFVIKTDHISLKYLLEQKINTASQHKGLSKLMGLDYVIEYKKGVENRVTDALSRREGIEEVETMELMAATELIPQWVQEVQGSYEGDTWVDGLKAKIEDANHNTDEHNHLTQHLQIIRYKGRICVGNNGN